MTTTLNVPEQQAKIAVRNLNFYYGKFHALKSINLNIPEKKVTALCSQVLTVGLLVVMVAMVESSETTIGRSVRIAGQAAWMVARMACNC